MPLNTVFVSSIPLKRARWPPIFIEILEPTWLFQHLCQVSLQIYDRFFYQGITLNGFSTFACTCACESTSVRYTQLPLFLRTSFSLTLVRTTPNVTNFSRTVAFSSHKDLSSQFQTKTRVQRFLNYAKYDLFLSRLFQKQKNEDSRKWLCPNLCLYALFLLAFRTLVLFCSDSGFDYLEPFRSVWRSLTCSITCGRFSVRILLQICPSIERPLAGRETVNLSCGK